MSKRDFSISEASNGGWIVTERLGTDHDGSVLVSTMAAFTNTADMVAALESILSPEEEPPAGGEPVTLQEGDV